MTLARLIDHTALDPETTLDDVLAACEVAAEHGCASVCVRPGWVPAAARALAGSGVRVTTVIAFPTGRATAGEKALEAAQAAAAGADEIDLVADIDALAEGRCTTLSAEVAAVRAAVPAATLKVILETAALTDEQISRAAHVCAALGADYVKTSTGYHPSGGATAHAVALLAGAGIGVKASGGIRTAEDARAMIAAGATRLGTSATAAILTGAAAPTASGY